MSVIWNKVWYDLWHMKVRTLLVVLSIAAGVFALGAIFGMNDQLLSGMDRAHQASFPSHIQMYLTRPVDRDTVIALKKVQGVEDIEPTNEVTVRYKIHPQDDWKQGFVYERDDYRKQIYDVYTLKQGDWPGKDDIGIERLSSQFFGVHVGDRVTFKLGETVRSLKVGGEIRHPFVLPPQIGGQAAFFASSEGLERFDVTPGQFGVLRVRVTPYSKDYAKDVASRIKDKLAKQDIGVAATLLQDPDKHWGRSFVEGLTLVLQILAIISLLASVVLVFNTLMAVITQQTSQIGVIKAIGGTTATITRVYLASVLVYGVLALVLSLPLGAMLAFSMTQMFLNLFNIDYSTFRVSNIAIVLQVLAATAVPMLAALFPVLNGARLTVRQAIASYGLGGDFKSTALDQAVEAIGRRFLPSQYAVALGNMFRRKGRLALTQGVLITAGTMFLVVMTLASSVQFTLDTDFGRRKFDVQMAFVDYQRIDRVLGMVQEVPGVEVAQVTQTHPATILRQGQKLKEAGLGAEITGVPLGSSLYRPMSQAQAVAAAGQAGMPGGVDLYKPLVVAGRWLEPGDGHVIVMSQKTAEDNNLQVGDTVTLDLAEAGKGDWTIKGLYQLIYGGGFNVNTLYVPQNAVFEATGKYNQGATLQVRVKDRTEAGAVAVADQLKEKFERQKMKVFFTQTLYESRRQSDNQFGIFINMLLGLAVVVAVVGGVGLMGSLSISVVERTKEIGVMRAVGARSRTILGMFVMEGVLQGVFSWLICVPLSFFLSQPLSRALGDILFQTSLDFKYNISAVVTWLILIVIISILASILPARNATRISVRDSLAYA